MIKEPYFTPRTIAKKAEEMLAAIASVPRRGAPFAPEKAALLLLDLQAYFLDSRSHAYSPSGEAILPYVNALAAAFALHERPIWLTRHVNTVENAGMMGTWWREVLTLENPLSRIDTRLQSSGGVTLNKPHYDAFLETPLEESLRHAGVHQVVICGVMTHLCCESTARGAFMRGFEVFFTVDGTATYTEAFHRASLLNLAHGFATPVLSCELLAMLNGNHG